MRGGRGALASVNVLFLSILVACGRERAAGAPAGDTGQTPAASDSTTASANPGAVATATPPRTTPLPRQPVKPKPVAPTRSPATMEAPDTQRAEAGAPLRDAYHQAPLDTVSQEVYQGWKQFNLNCARCHGEDVQGTTIAPHLIVSLRPDGSIPTKALFMQTVCAGRPEKGMPSWCTLGLDMGKIDTIYSYVKGRSEGKIHQGRPAVRQ